MTFTKDWLKRFGWPETLLTGHPLAIAHRGASDHAPENTLKAFRVAADLCSEMWELDVHLSADGVCVVVHDDNLTRVARRGLKVSESRWDEISELQLPEGQRVPRLEQVIELAKETGCGLYIEIKSEGAGPVAWDLLRKAEFRFACLASFNVDWVRELRQLGCEYPLGVLVPVGADPFTCLDGVEVEIVHLCWRDASDAPHELLTGDLMRRFEESGHQIVIWHEDRREVVDALLQQPLMGVCSNRPELLKPYRPDPAHPVDIVCHRGANTLAPENTLEAARICIDQRFQYVELDMRTTADGELVVIHDADVQRTSDGSGLVTDMTLEQIKSLDAGGWFRESSAGYRVPTLDQMLDLVRGTSGLYIEVKDADPVKLLDVVSKAEMLGQCFFWGYDVEKMRQLRTLAPEAVLMATRWMYTSVREAVAAYGAQIVEFDVEKDDLAELSECDALGVRSMIFSRQHSWSELETCLNFRPDLVNLDRPDRYKILTSYPRVRQHFQASKQGRYTGAVI
jgi:glycerophosphoryl diester phosphodiesterase